MNYNKLIICLVFAVPLLFFWETESLLSEEGASLHFDMTPFKLTDVLSDSEMKVWGQILVAGGIGPEAEQRRTEMQRPEVYKPFLEERFILGSSRIGELESAFMKFNLLRTVAKKVTLRWYEEEEWDSTTENYVPNAEKLRTHIVVDNEDLLRWRSVLSSAAMLRGSTASPFASSRGGWRTHPSAPLPHHAIVFETDKEKVFIGITRMGLHLGEWEGNKIDGARIFFSPELALCLDDYIKKHKLENFPATSVDALSGKFMVQFLLDFYPNPKR